MRQFTFTTHQTLAGCAAGWPRFLLDRHDRRLRFPIPSQQLQQPAAQVSLLLPPMSVGAKQLSQYFWLRPGRGWRLQIAIFNMLLQPEGGGLHILFPSDRCAAAEAKNKAENPPLSPLQSQRVAGRWVAGSRSRRGGRLWPHLLLCLSFSSFYFNFLFTQRSGAVGQSKAEAALSLVGRPRVRL